MTAFIFAGDMFVMLFMMGVVVWVSMGESKQRVEHTANIPLEDENTHG
ncbi:MAG: cbb3-type cytochrome c oxidase subunit 3 [Pseudohongiellaceae bacterium]|nr:cbb3-type cytochrome c oxidase subunit 3 [Pseudohongiellaceae bacterium]